MRSNVAELPDTVERLNRAGAKAHTAMCRAKAAVLEAQAAHELKPTAANHRAIDLAKRDYRRARDAWNQAEDAHRSAAA
jgi:hypothetical protein